jgi:hypothetical protein
MMSDVAASCICVCVVYSAGRLSGLAIARLGRCREVSGLAIASETLTNWKCAGIA